MKKTSLAIVITIALVTAAWNYVALPNSSPWSTEESRLIASLALDALPPLPNDPSNSVADSELAAELGRKLYFDTALSSNGEVACATCHKPELMFSDGLTLAVGTGIGPRHTPSLVGLSYSPWYYWDGRKDSQWAQALAPLEASIEHGTNRTEILHLIAADSDYRTRYEKLFGDLPDTSSLPASASPQGNQEQQTQWHGMDGDTQNSISRVFANLGKAIAAYQRKILPGAARFDNYVAALANANETTANEHLSNAEIAGLRLFIGKAQCISCHNGPLFTNHEFHNTGVMAVLGQLPPMGRYDGVRIAREDPFNCLGLFSDADSSECTELRFARDENDLVGAQKTPTLRNISLTAPYMHGGQIKTLKEVVDHYNDAPSSMLSHNEAKPLGLRAVERRQLEQFMQSLTAPLATDPKWLKAAE